MRTYGLIGNPVVHSFSEKYFSDKFKREDIRNAQYSLFLLNEIEELQSLIQQVEFSGLNVTIPYKQSVIRYLDEIDEEALAVGAVNTVKFFKKNNKTITKGFNTDVFGFEKLLEKHNLPDDTQALILGTGGSSRAVAYILKKNKIPFSFVSRNPSNSISFSYKILSGNMISEHKLIINTTPLGMSPDVLSFPDIPYNFITNEHYCIDLIYNPEKTIFLQKCEHREANIINGMEMLISQAERSWEIWNQ
mgnify:CR=1 FL=1